MTAPLPPIRNLPPGVLDIVAALEGAGYETWCVGGALRDRLLGLPGEDVDLATAATPEQVLTIFPRAIAVGVKYGTVGVLDGRRVMHEVTTFRKDVSTDGRHAVVAYGVSLEEDLARRDFTMNALAYHPSTERWQDPFGGAIDIQRKIIRAVGQPAQRFAEDYLRVLRALRFAARFGFTIDPETWRAALEAAPGLANLSAERVREEWFKGLRTAQALPLLVDFWTSSGAAAIWLPELSTGPGISEASPDPRDPVVLTAGLCSQAGAVMQRLRASGQEIERARAIDRGPREPAGADAVAVRRWMAQVGEAVDDLLLLARYHRGAEPPWAQPVQGIRERGEAVSRSQLAVTGDDLSREGIPSGPGMGQLLGRLLDFVLDHPEANTRETLLARVKTWS